MTSHPRDKRFDLLSRWGWGRSTFRSKNFSQGIFQSKIFVLGLAKRSYKMNFITSSR